MKLTNGVLTINPATISYTIGNASHAYGGAPAWPATCGRVRHGVNGQNLSIAYSGAGNTATADVGSSRDYRCGLHGTGAAGLTSDYRVKLTNGALTINPEAFSYTIGNGSHVYGSTDDLAADLGATFDTGINSQNLNIAYAAPATRRRPLSAVPHHRRGLQGTGGTAGLVSDYRVKLTNGLLTITPAR